MKKNRRGKVLARATEKRWMEPDEVQYFAERSATDAGYSSQFPMDVPVTATVTITAGHKPKGAK